MPSNNPSQGDFLPNLAIVVGRMAPLLLPILHHGTHQRHPADPLTGGAEAAAAVDGAEVEVEVEVDGAADHKWLPTQRLRGRVEVVGVVPILGLNRLLQSFLNTLAVLQQP